MNSKQKIVNALPLTGVKSITSDGNGILLGDAENGIIYRIVNDVITVETQTGEFVSVDNLLNISDSQSSLFSCGGKLILLIGKDILDQISSVSPTVSTGNTITIMDLGEETITDLIEVKETGAIILSTIYGRILSCGKEMINAYLTGNRTIYADVMDGFGLSNSATTSILYALYNRIAEINEEREIVKWKYEYHPFSAILEEKLTGIFLSPIIHVQEDLGFWKELVWEEVKPDNTEIVISLRAADSTNDLMEQPWKYAYVSNVAETSPITRVLNNVGLSGQYLQMKVEMTTEEKDITPIVSRTTIKYSTKQASYFFTTTFSLARNAEANSGFITATITEPQNTEIRFGIADKKTSDWKDYKVCDPDKLFEVINPEAVKVGIKFISYAANVPEVAEFAVAIGSQNSQIVKVI